MRFYIYNGSENGHLKRKPVLHPFFTNIRNQPVSILFNYIPGHPGSFYSRNGDPGDPPEPPDVEFIHVLQNGIEIELTDEEYEKISDQIIEHIESRIAEELINDLQKEKAYANEMSL